jgi:hypothetical protein
VLSRIPFPVAAIAALLCWQGCAWAQRGHGGMGRGGRAPMHEPNGRGGMNAPKGPGAAIQQFQRMSPQEREEALSRLPPERQQKLREQLQRYDQLPEERKQQLQRLWQLPPEQQARVRDRIRDFNESPPDRKRAMRQQLRELGGMTPDERKAYFKSDEFKSQFSSDERDTLKAMSQILPPE